MILSWIHTNREAVGLSVRQCAGITNWVGLFDFRLSMSFGAQLVHGAGTAKKVDEAVAIAASEACERAVVRATCAGRKVLGSAAGSTLAKAREGAQREAIERRSFASHFSANSPGHRWSLDRENTGLTSIGRELLARMRAPGHRVDLIDLAGTTRSRIVLAIATLPTAKLSESVVVGLGNNERADHAAEHALIEVARNYIAAMSDNSDAPDGNQIIVADPEVVTRYRQLAGDSTIRLEVDWNIPNVEALDLSGTALAGAPIFVAAVCL